MDEPPSEDLTARARIRNTAVRLFAERGMARTTIRDIARTAGVSGGLVIHHFGSKEELRDACDAWALDRVMRITRANEQALDGHGGDAPADLLATAHPEIVLLARYLTSSMLDDSPAASAIFGQMVDVAERWLSTHYPDLTTDPRAAATVYVAMLSGPLVLHDPVARAMGADPLSPEGHLRMTRAMLDLHARMLPSDYLGRARRAIDRAGSRNR